MSGPYVAHQPYPRPQGEDPLKGPVRRRHVIYVQGFFPQGPSYYHALLKKQQAHYAQLYGLKAQGSALVRENSFWRCTLNTAMDGESVQTVYDFLDWEDIIRAAHRRSLFHTAWLAAVTFVGHFVDGTFAAMLRLRWKFAAAWLLPYVVFLLIGLFSAIAALGVYEAAQGAPFSFSKIAIALSALIGLWKLNRLYFCASMLRSFNYAYQYAKGRTPAFEERISAFGDVVASLCKTSDADEVLIVGHSFGGQLAVRVAAEALHKGVFVGNQGRIKLLTLGDAGMHVALMRGPGADRVRKAVFAVSGQHELPWIVVYSGKDTMSFDNVDPPSASKGFEGEKAQAEDFAFPLMYDMRLRHSLDKQDYRRLRWRFFHLHGFFIMAARLRTASFDYLRLVCGAAPLALSGKRISAK